MAVTTWLPWVQLPRMTEGAHLLLLEVTRSCLLVQVELSQCLWFAKCPILLCCRAPRHAAADHEIYNLQAAPLLAYQARH